LAPHLAAPHFAAPHLAAPHLAAPHLAAPHLAAPHLAAPHLAALQADALQAPAFFPFFAFFDFFDFFAAAQGLAEQLRLALQFAKADTGAVAIIRPPDTASKAASLVEFFIKLLSSWL
jgi:hypothetical protein